MLREVRLWFYLDDCTIYHFYLDEFSGIDKKYHSPFRDDPGPSLAFTRVGERVFWKDFGRDTEVYPDGVGFVQQMYGLSRPQAVSKVWEDIISEEGTPIKTVRYAAPIKFNYEFEKQPLQDFEMEYWDQLGFSKQFLKFFNVWSLKAMRRLGKKIWTSTKDNPAFIYLFNKFPKTFKAYRPLDPRRDKFRGQHNGDIIEGWDQLPPSGDTLIITSSLKDTMSLRALGYLSCNPTSENSLRTLLTKVPELNQRFRRIFVLFDADTAGIQSTEKICTLTGWSPIHFFGLTKDPSDLITSAGCYQPLANFMHHEVPSLCRYNTGSLDPTEA